MVREIMRDIIFLGRASAPATAEDGDVARDLLDTLMHHARGCVGMAANMIGVAKCIIAVNDGGKYLVMFNPKIVKFSGPYDTEEGCLSLDGVRPVRRYHSIKLEYQTPAMEKRLRSFTGYTAQIIQHEIDHCRGIII